MVASKSAANKPISKKIAIFSTLTLAVCWSSIALGRAQLPDADCDEIARDLESLETPAQTLTINKVDHVDLEAPTVDVDTVGLDTASGEAATPLLFLTPRVEDALRDVFADDEGALPASPIAESEEVGDVDELIDESEPQVPDEIDVPLLQRQMFRTDI